MSDPHVTRHLLHVAAVLGRETRPDLSPPVARRRRRLLGALERYARAGRFPRPDGPVPVVRRKIAPRRAFAGPGVRAPLFEDSAGRRCAVGHLLGLARPDLVAAIRDSDNGVFLPELDLPALARWAARHGLTADELAWIQPSYCWEIPECTPDFEVAEPAPYPPDCTGPNATALGTSGRAMSCQECDGPLRTLVWVHNAGSETATDVTVTLGADEELLDVVVLPQLAAGERVQVELLAPDVATVNHRGWVEARAVDDCASSVRRLELWGSPGSYYPPGYVAPESCGGGCSTYGYGTSDTSDTATDGTADTGTPSVPEDTAGPDTAEGDTADDVPEPKGGCGCSPGGTGPGSVGWVALAIGLRRRRARA